MDGIALGFIVVLGIEVAVIGGLVAYLLFRPNDKNNKSKLQPEDKVSTAYGDGYSENGQVLLDVKDPHETTSDASSTSSEIKKKPLDVDSITIDIENSPLYHDAPPTVIDIDGEPEPPDKIAAEEPIIDGVQVHAEEKEPEHSTSSSSSSEDEKQEVEEPLIDVTQVPAVHYPHSEDDKNKSSSSSSSDEEVEEAAGVEEVDAPSDEKDDYLTLSQKPVPMERTVLVTKSTKTEFASSSSTTSEDTEEYVQYVKTKKKKKKKQALTSSSSSSSSSSSEETEEDTQITKRKKKKKKRYSVTTSSSDEEIFNHKKKIHRKRYIHNIEEVEIIEEHTYNKTHKTIYKKTGENGEIIYVEGSETEQQEPPNVVVTKRRRSRRKEGDGSFSSSSSKSSEQPLKSPDKTFHTEYHYDVSKKRKEDEDDITTTVIETTSPPQVTTHRTYTETIEENKRKEFEMCMSRSGSESDADVKMRSEKNISISPTPGAFRPFVATVAVEEEKTEVPRSSSSSSSSSSSESEVEEEEIRENFTKEEEEEMRLRSETSINLRSPSYTTVTKTLTFDENTIVIPRSSSSSSSESDSEVRMSSSKMIQLKSPPRQEEVVTVTVMKEETSGVLAASSSSSSSSSDEKEVILPPPSAKSLSDDEAIDSVTNLQETKVSEIIDSSDRGTEVTEGGSSTTITTEEIVVTTTTREKKKSKKDFKFTSGWKRQVTLDDLFKAGVVSQTTIDQLQEGQIEQEEVEKSIRVYLVGEEPIAGLMLSDTGEKISIYDAWKRGLIRRGTSISLLEAQAATGRIINPKTAEKMSVNEAAQNRLIDRQFEAVLTRAERAVYGYKTRLSNDILSLFEAMKRGLVVENHGIRLLEAQIATGGIVDPNANHRLPVQVAFDRNLFDKRLNDILEDPSDDTRGFFDPNTEENLTYIELMERCVVDKDTGIRLLPLRSKKVSSAIKHSKVVFESATNRQVLLKDIVDAELLDMKTAQKFDEGTMTSEEVNSMVAELKVYVDGTLPIAGVISSKTAEKLSILEASRGGLIRKGTAFELLEAQAACGKIMDVQSGKAVSIETALRTGVIDSEFEDVVSRANRAVTGYREPFKRDVLSLCEAMSRHLVVQRHAIRLLEAQIATGGIVDMKSPVRINVSVANKRGLIDRSLAYKLEKRKTASYFDPMTGENLNYSELMARCVLDKDTNLLFLMVEGGTVTQNIRPFEPEPDSMKIREKSHAKLTTEVVESKSKKRSSSSTRSESPTPDVVPSSPPAILSRRVVIVDPNTGDELTVQEALEQNLIDKATAKQLLAQEGDFEEKDKQDGEDDEEAL